MRMMPVLMAAARSLSIIINFRFPRSTRVPTKGPNRVIGVIKKNPTRARGVALPVIS